ncbi:hypothetical protein HIM_07661 [Hirsutella minnesotensis 3608]|uniref:Large ribosomal subunit protein mL43 n=1 Tax=Hirsutella minnesotensis 3608 TaxID=1043627 RepID=A0A0F7ZTD0_9HYPO|nr:hypothetical protein HIM_07661 [Hirsutella minnesotensis 3608]
MTVRALRAISKAGAISTNRNGVGAFLLPCRKLNFFYCDWAGSSVGMCVFIQALLPKFAAAHPQIEICVSPRPGKHPSVVAHYVNGRTKPVCTRNLDASGILRKVTLLRDSSGERLIKTNKPVKSKASSIRGIWSPYHGTGMPV